MHPQISQWRGAVMSVCEKLLTPVGVNIDGLGRDILLLAGDLLWGSLAAEQRLMAQSQRGFVNSRGGTETVKLDPAQPNERLMCYGLDALLSTYGRSPLGKVIRFAFRGRTGTFVDIGANLGLYSLIARAAGAENTILFEPEPIHAAFLVRNRDLFGDVYDIALSERSGFGTLHVGSEKKLGVSSLVETNDGTPYSHDVSAQVECFDTIAFRDGSEALEGAWTNVRLLKIDVEGHEVEVLRGMQRFLAASTTNMIWCEVRGPASGRAPNTDLAVTDLLARYGYHPCELRRGRPIPHRVTRQRRVYDILYCKLTT